MKAPWELRRQSRTQSPRAFWSLDERQERLWNNELHVPSCRKRGFPPEIRLRSYVSLIVHADV